MSSTAADSGSQMSYEKLLLLAKQLKAKAKRLEGEKEALITERDAALEKAATTGASAPIKSSPMPAKAFMEDPMLFWTMLDTASPLIRKLGGVALTMLTRGMRPSAAPAFSRWKAVCQEAKVVDLSTQLDASRKTIQELQQKALKLKTLLARTHSASKQQQEQALQQQEQHKTVTAESRQHAVEREVLLEKVRSKAIEAAFQRDLELVIQDAASGVELALKDQLAQKGESRGGVSGAETAAQLATVLKDNIEPAEPGGLEPAELVRPDDAQVAHLRDQLSRAEAGAAEARAALSQKSDDLAVMEKKLRRAQEDVEDLRRRFNDERAAHKEIEMELELTVASRSELLSKVDQRHQQQQRQSNEENALGVQQLRLQCENSERKLSAACKQLELANKESDKLKAALVASERARGESKDLRRQIVDLRRAVKGRSSADSVDRSSEKAATRRNEKLVTELSTMGLQLCARFRNVVQSFKRRTVEAVSVRSALHTLLHRVLDTCEEHIPINHETEHAKAEAMVRTLQQRLAELQEERELKHYESAVPSGPLTWESSRIDVLSGAHVDIPIPSQVSEARLNWKLTGSAGNFILGIRPRGVDIKSSETRTLDTNWNTNEEAYSGRTTLPADHQHYMLSLSNNGWTAASVGYFVSLTVEPTIPETESTEVDSLTEQVQQACKQLHQLDRINSLRSRCKELRSSLLDAEIAEARAISPQDADNQKDGGFAIAEHRNYFSAAEHTFGVAQNDLQSSVGAESKLKGPVLGMLRSEENVVISASKSLQVPLTFSEYPPPFTVVWCITLQEKASKDVGFTVMLRKADGSLPQLVPHQRYRGQFKGSLYVPEESDGDAIVVLLDNQHSWLNKKSLTYEIEVHGKASAETANEEKSRSGDTEDNDLDEVSDESSFAVTISTEPVEKSRLFELLQETFQIHHVND